MASHERPLRERGVEKRRLKACIEDEGLAGLLGSSGFLPELVRTAGWSFRVGRFAARAVHDRRLWDLDIEVPREEEIDLPLCQGVRVTLGNRLATTGLNLRLVSGRDRVADRAGGSTVAVLRGDLSLVLPRVGLVPVGRVATPPARPGAPLRLSPDAASLLGARRTFGAALGSSLLVIDGARSSLRVTPALDLRGIIYRVADTGILVGFEGLSVSCDGTTPRVDFRGGRLWRQAGAG